MLTDLRTIQEKVLALYQNEHDLNINGSNDSPFGDTPMSTINKRIKLKKERDALWESLLPIIRAIK